VRLFTTVTASKVSQTGGLRAVKFRCGAKTRRPLAVVIHRNREFCWARGDWDVFCIDENPGLRINFSTQSPPTEKMTSGVVDINVIDAFVGEFRHAVGPAKKKGGH